MKIFLLILLVVVIMLIAKGVANQYKEKNLFYVAILQFLNAYELNIGFKKEKIKRLVEKQNFTSRECKILFDEYLGYLRGQNELSFEKIKVISYEERELLIDLFVNLGTGDYSSEMTQLSVFKSLIQNKIDNTEKESLKNYPLIIKLSFLFSLGLALVFI